MGETDRQNTFPILWNADSEVCLFYAMRGFKPVGVNKHFHMMAIHSKFIESLGQPVTSAQLWEHLSGMYNLAVLDESDGLPFDNEVTDFELPDEILNFGKEAAKKKEPDTAEKSVVKSSIVKETQPLVKSTPTTAKPGRKRTRNVAPSPGAVGPGAHKRKRH